LGSEELLCDDKGLKAMSFRRFWRNLYKVVGSVMKADGLKDDGKYK